MPLEVVKYFFENGSTEYNYVLRWASYAGHIDIVKYLVENGANVHGDNDCALRLASVEGHIDIVKYLVENGADNHYALRLVNKRLFKNYKLH